MKVPPGDRCLKARASPLETKNNSEEVLGSPGGASVLAGEKEGSQKPLPTLAEWGPRLALAGVKALWEAGQVVHGAPEFLVTLVPGREEAEPVASHCPVALQRPHTLHAVSPQGPGLPHSENAQRGRGRGHRHRQVTSPLHTVDSPTALRSLHRHQRPCPALHCSQRWLGERGDRASPQEPTAAAQAPSPALPASSSVSSDPSGSQLSSQGPSSSNVVKVPGPNEDRKSCPHPLTPLCPT